MALEKLKQNDNILLIHNNTLLLNYKKTGTGGLRKSPVYLYSFILI